jgi:GntR family transcriptional regulator
VIFEINPSSTVPVYQQLKDQIKRSISSGLLASDAKVPSVRDLAVHLRINPNTVAKAFRELELEGVLYSRKGQGTFVCQVQPQESYQTRLAKLTVLVDDLLLNADQLAIKTDDVDRLIKDRIEKRAASAIGSSDESTANGDDFGDE